jgi:hypothetical protein
MQLHIVVRLPFVQRRKWSWEDGGWAFSPIAHVATYYQRERTASERLRRTKLANTASSIIAQINEYPKDTR